MDFWLWLWIFWIQVWPNLAASLITFSTALVWHQHRIRQLIDNQKQHLESELKNHLEKLGIGDDA